MIRFGILALAATAAFAVSGPARATDLFEAITPAPSATYEDGFDWEGFYLGVFVGAYGEIDSNFRAVTAGKVLGYNWVSGNLLLGLRATGWFMQGTSDPSNYWLVSGDARIGVLLSDAVLAYAFAGGGSINGANNPFSSTFGQGGAGLEFAATDNLSLFIEGVGRYYVLTDFCCGLDARAGAIWHFN